MASFTINECGDAFDILSKSLYSNPAASCVREITMNAIDATIEACSAQQVKVDYDGAAYSVRDFGKGMTPDFIEELYTHYFSSTKKGAKNQTGMFGLGSKSPFAVTNRFKVITFVDGTKYTWVMEKKDHEAPTASLAFTEKTTEPNGTLIYVPTGISKRDIIEELGNIAYEFQYGDEFMQSFSDADLELLRTKQEKLTEIENYPVRHPWHYGPYGALVGNYYFDCIEFPANLKTKIEAYLSSRNLAQFKFYGITNFIFKKGEVNLTPSRENLSFDEVTEAGIMKALEKIADNTQKIMAEFEVAKNEGFDALQAWCKKYPTFNIDNDSLKNAVETTLKAKVFKLRKFYGNQSTWKFQNCEKSNFEVFQPQVLEMNKSNTFNVYSGAKTIKQVSCSSDASEYVDAKWFLLTPDRKLNNGFSFFAKKVVQRTVKAGPRNTGFYVGYTTFFYPAGGKAFYSSLSKPEDTVKRVGYMVADAEKCSAEKSDFYSTIAMLTKKIVAVKWLCKDPAKYDALSQNEITAIAKEAAKDIKFAPGYIVEQVKSSNARKAAYLNAFNKCSDEFKAWVQSSLASQIKVMKEEDTTKYMKETNFPSRSALHKVIGEVDKVKVGDDTLEWAELAFLLKTRSYTSKLMPMMTALEAATFMKNFKGQWFDEIC